MRVQRERFRHLVAAMSASALVLLGAGCSKTETAELSTQGLYAVLEVTPLLGTAPDGCRVGPVRVMVVDPQSDASAGKPLEAEGLSQDCLAPPSPCDSVAYERGGLVLRSPGTHVLEPGALSSWEAGDERVLRGTQLNFTTLDRGPVLTLSGSQEAPAEARVKLLKKCEVRIVQVKHASSESELRGAFSSSKPAPRSWVEVARPRCFEGMDRHAESPSIDEKKAEAYAFRDAGRTSMERVANEWVAQHPPESTGWEALSPLERKLNPKAAGLMHAGQLAKLSIKWGCLQRQTVTKRKLFGTVKTANVCKKRDYMLIVEWSGGVRRGVYRRPRDTGSWTQQSTAHSLAVLFVRVWLDENGWLRLERPQDFSQRLRAWVTEPSDETIIDELQELLTFLAVHVPPPGDPVHKQLPYTNSWSFFSADLAEDEDEEKDE